MKTFFPIKFATGDSVRPSVLNENFQRQHADVADDVARQYHHGCFKLDFSGLGVVDNGTAKAAFLIKAPRAWEIEGVELYVYGATTVTGVTLAATGTTGWADATATPAGATTRAYGTSDARATVAASTEVAFSLTCAGAGVTTACWAMVHYRTSRNTGAATPTLDPVRFDDNDDVAAAKLNTAFTAIETITATNTANDKQMHISVHQYRPASAAISAEQGVTKIADGGRRLNSADVVVVGDNTVTMTWALTDPTVSIALVGNGTTAKTQNYTTGLPASQTTNDPGTVAYDSTLTVSRSGAGNVDLTYCVLYWT